MISVTPGDGSRAGGDGARGDGDRFGIGSETAEEEPPPLSNP